MGGVLPGHAYSFPSFWISPASGLPITKTNTAEPSYFYSVPFGERLAHMIKYRVNTKLDISGSQMQLLRC